jgi:hypothetical protein
MRRRPSTTITLLLFVVVSVFNQASISCNPSQDISNLPQLDSAEKSNLKLDSQLSQLVRAEMSGKAVLFAEQSNIDLVNSDVRVIIECVPGQLEAATEEVTAVGGKLEAVYKNLLQVVVPIAELNHLAGEASIHFIRLPQQSLPAESLHEQMGSLMEGNSLVP